MRESFIRAAMQLNSIEPEVAWDALSACLGEGCDLDDTRELVFQVAGRKGFEFIVVPQEWPES